MSPDEATRLALTTLDTYVASLPDGLESYSECRATGATFRNLLASAKLPLGVGLPPALEKWIRAQPSENEWVPVVHLCGLHAAAYDCMFAQAGGMDAYLEWTFERNKAMVAMPIYAPLLATSTPEFFLTAFRARWSVFYRGISFDVVRVEKNAATLRLSYPAYCWPEISQLSLGVALRAVLATNTKTLSITSTEISPSASQYDLQWS
ncbi:MAG: hypothetical protein ABI183_01130 [Polyangiaceae bacterium]